MVENERRKQQDIWRHLLKILAIFGWLLFIFALVMSYYAAPDNDYGVLRYHGIDIRKFWLTPLTGYLYIILWFSALISYLSILLNKYRNRRKTDDKQFNVLLLFIICVAWIVYIMLQIIKHSAS